MANTPEPDDREPDLADQLKELADLVESSPEAEETFRKLDEGMRKRFGDEVSPMQILADSCTPRTYVSFHNPGEEAKFGPYVDVTFEDNQLIVTAPPIKGSDALFDVITLAEFDGKAWTVLDGPVYEYVRFHSFGHEDLQKKELPSISP